LAKHLSVEKRQRQSKKTNVRNRTMKSKLKTARKNLEKSMEKKDTDSLTALFNEYVSLVDKAASKGVIHKNNAARKKMKMAGRVSSLKAP